MLKQRAEGLAKMFIHGLGCLARQSPDVDLNAHHRRNDVRLLIWRWLDHVGRERRVGAGMEVAGDTRERERSKELVNRTGIQ